MPMKPMFLPGVEANPQPGPYAENIRLMQAAGKDYPQIWHMLAFRTEITDHLTRFTEEIMHGEAPLSPGLRELIAAYISYQNQCAF